MLVLEHMKQLVKACNPQSPEEWNELWANINPVKFGNVVNWQAATTYNLADYQVPLNCYLVVLRVETYTVNTTNAATDYGMIEPPPSGTAYWQQVPYGSGAPSYPLTDEDAQSQLALDADEFLIFQGGINLNLIGDFDASPDGDTREVRTLVYAYDCGPQVVERIGAGQAIIAPSN
jgi:hypothetical protein